jgi:type III pantothenate kinase
MFLAIDIGNTSISMGIFEGDGLVTFKINTHPLKAAEEHAKFIKGILKGKKPDGVALCSVVPGQTGTVCDGAKLATGREPLIVSHASNHGLTLDVDTPEEIGADRLAESAAAAELFGAPVVVVDFGTATNVNFIGDGNVYKGGAILPGPELMGRALSSQTAKLPEIMPGPTGDALGRDTKSSILSGIIYGTAGAVERIIAEVEASEDETFKVVVTGGAHEHVLPALRRVDHVEPALTLKGLKLIYERSL